MPAGIFHNLPVAAVKLSVALDFAQDPLDACVYKLHMLYGKAKPVAFWCVMPEDGRRLC